MKLWTPNLTTKILTTLFVLPISLGAPAEAATNPFGNTAPAAAPVSRVTEKCPNGVAEGYSLDSSVCEMTFAQFENDILHGTGIKVVNPFK